MITSDGKTLLVKYLLGQAPSMASHIAVGCGPTPITNTSYSASVQTVQTNGTTVTLTTTAAHTFLSGDSITVTNLNANIIGSYTISSASTPNLSYTISSSYLTSTPGLIATLTSGQGIVTLTTGTTTNLNIGQTLTKTAGTGVFGTPSDSTPLRIIAITSSTTFIVNAPHTTTGSITFTANDASYMPIYPYGTVAKNYFANYTTKKTLDMEMFRIPIESRGYIVENGITKIAFSGRLPQEERYEITELGIYSAGSNPSSGSYGSKNIFNFSTSEPWSYYNGSKITMPAPVADSLDSIGPSATTQVINTTTFAVPTKINSDNPIFMSNTVTYRQSRYERCRYLGSNIMIPGNWSTYDATLNLKNNYIIYDNFNIDMSQAMPNDELRLAFSVIDSGNNSGNTPPGYAAWIVLELVDVNSNTYRFFYSAPTATLSSTRYNVISRTISQGTAGASNSSPFSWANVKSVRIYAAAMATSSTTSNSFYICLDSLRFENKTVDNPLYKLVAYSPIATPTGSTLIKDAGTANSIQFKMGITT